MLAHVLVLQVCVAVARKKAISIYTVTDEKLLLIKEVAVLDSVVRMVSRNDVWLAVVMGKY